MSQFQGTAVITLSCYRIGIYTDGASSEEQSLFVTERHCLSDLVEGLTTQCPCGVTRAPWVLESVVQVQTCGMCTNQYYNMCVLIKYMPERTCDTSYFLLSSLQEAKTYMVQFPCACGSLFGQSKVRCCGA